LAEKKGESEGEEQEEGEVKPEGQNHNKEEQEEEKKAQELASRLRQRALTFWIHQLKKHVTISMHDKLALPPPSTCSASFLPSFLPSFLACFSLSFISWLRKALHVPSLLSLQLSRLSFISHQLSHPCLSDQD